MKCNLKNGLSLCFALCAFIIFTVVINGCSGGHVHGRWGKNPKPKPKPHQAEYEYNHKHKQKHHGPPAHAKAHGYRAKHQYRYYPDQKVYHDPDRGLYFYLKGDNWEVGASLPSPLISGLGESVTIELDADNPSVYNADHVKQYPPKKSKGTKKKKLAKKK